MNAERTLLLTFACVLAAACGAPADLPADGHLLVTLDTDAPLPSSTDDAAGIFDSVLLEITDADGAPACGDCTRQLGLTREVFAQGATFVVRTARPSLLRARLFASRLGVAALDAGSVVERWSQLPAAPAEGETNVLVALPLASVGVPLGSRDAPTPAGTLAERLAPLPPESARTPSSPSEVCVSGGWFWMGNPRLPAEDELTANVPRLVHVASFCVDAHEATVSELRASGVDTASVVPWSGTTDPASAASFCPFTKTPGPNEDRAVSCVPWATARAACQAAGTDLPTEAQLEYLGTALGRTSFVWGEDPPACADALVARAIAPQEGDRSCAADAKRAVMPFTAADFASTRDVLPVPGGAVVGLASNVAEWTRERFEPFGAACRGAPAGPLRDPECAPDASTTRIAVRGGNLTGTPGATAAAVRSFVVLPKDRTDLGYRCVR